MKLAWTICFVILWLFKVTHYSKKQSHVYSSHPYLVCYSTKKFAHTHIITKGKQEKFNTSYTQQTVFFLKPYNQQTPLIYR